MSVRVDQDKESCFKSTRNKGGGELVSSFGERGFDYTKCSVLVNNDNFRRFLISHLHFFSPDNDSLAMADAIKMINKAADLCFSNKFLQAKAELEPW